MSFEEALEMADRDERFRATVYAMNTLLIQKGVYSHEEFEALFVGWVSKEAHRNASRRGSEHATTRVEAVAETKNRPPSQLQSH